MEEDQRLTPLPKTTALREVNGDYAPSYSSYYDDESFEGRRSIRQHLAVVVKRLPWILALTILVTSAAAFYMYRQKPEYEATTLMLIEPRRPKVTSKDSININFGNDVNYYNTQLKLLQNAELMREVVVDLKLHEKPDLFGSPSRGFGETLRSIFTSEKRDAGPVLSLPVIRQDEGTAAQGRPALSPEELNRANHYAAVLAGGMSVSQRERTNLVDVSVKAHIPELAAAVANRVAEVFKRQDAERETEGAVKAKNDLEKSIEELEKTISDQEGEQIAFMRESNLPLAEKGQELAASRLQGLSATWIKAIEDRRQLEGRYNAAVAANNRGEGRGIPELTESKIYQEAVRLATERRAKLQDDIRNIDKQIQAAETERAELLVRYTPEYSEVQKRDERITSLTAAKERLERETTDLIERERQTVDRDAVNSALVSMRSLLESKRREEAQAQAAYEREAQIANVQGVAATRLTTLSRSIETNRNLLDTYRQRVKEQELAIENSSPDNIKIAAEAIAPTTPIGPQRNRNIMIAFLLSLAAGIGLAFLMDYLDDSVKTSDDIGRHLGLPTLALIPHHSGTERRRLSLGPANGQSPPVTSIVTLEERHSPMAEAYRHLRTSLLFSSAGKPPQTILVTSSQPSEGKTTTAINTAITLAQSDADVVIIDCDLRRPRLHTYFEMENTQGLTNYLSGEPNTDQLIKRCKGLPKLRVITSGPIPPNPAELLSSDEMKKLIQFLRGRYKHVIIDSPPAISFTDASILSTLVDGVVIVAMAGKSSMHLMKRFKQRLGNIGARVYGVVLNGIKANSMEYDYYGSGYYEYYGKSEVDTATPYFEDVNSKSSTNGH
ncbi:MAG TPA: polysaccharide biosynthesis tyrosine autokinase [Pyrinomonadaceae bacterium]|nr:polysaccharide biosynthesis tyrosine autokinase [Pyrinomonadaceae bacterium]